jgi:hypothetical protein
VIYMDFEQVEEADTTTGEPVDGSDGHTNRPD